MTRAGYVMHVEYVAAIAEDDYETFKTVLTTELPRDYEMWLRVRQRGKLRALNEGATKVVEVDVTPDDFGAYCRGLKRPDFSIASLDLCAVEKAAHGDVNAVAGSAKPNGVRSSV
jgi:hypothetical protein